MQTFEEWLNEVISSGNLCEEYIEKLNNAVSNKQIMDIMMDANGISYLPEMERAGIPLPYDIIHNRFGNYFNGNYIAEFRNDKGNGYNSKIYCEYKEDEIIADITLLCVLGYTGTIKIEQNNFCEIYLDSKCDVKIKCPNTAKVIAHHWGSKCPEIISGTDRITLIQE